MSILERDCVLVSKDESGNTIIDMPVTRVNNVEGLGRNPGTAYSVGDVVMCNGSKQLQLICTTAGTTSTADLDISANSAGDTINDGTVMWLVAKINHFNNSGILPISEGGTGADNSADACANIGAVPHFNKDNTSGSIICGGTNWEDGAGFYVAGQNDEMLGVKGAFTLRAKNGDASTTLQGNPNGDLFWNGINLIDYAENATEAFLGELNDNNRFNVFNTNCMVDTGYQVYGIVFDCAPKENSAFRSQILVSWEGNLYVRAKLNGTWTNFDKAWNGWRMALTGQAGDEVISLNNGLHIEWGALSLNGNKVFTFKRAFTTIPKVFLTDRGDARVSFGVKDVSTTNFTVCAPASNVGVNYLAIGY